MDQNYTFNMEFIGRETHLVLPTLTSIVLVQNLYDALFQYALNKEQEQKLEDFIKKLEGHIKKKIKAPFSIPVDEMEFLGEGLEELRLMNWMQIPVLKFAVNINDYPGRSEEQDKELLQNITEDLQDYLIVNRRNESNILYVFPYRITSY